MPVMSGSEPGRGADLGDAAWAHNRWPTVGLFSGAGVGLVLGLVFESGWLWTALFVVALAVGGCLGGAGLAALVYRHSDDPPGGPGGPGRG